MADTAANPANPEAAGTPAAPSPPTPAAGGVRTSPNPPVFIFAAAANNNNATNNNNNNNANNNNNNNNNANRTGPRPVSMVWVGLKDHLIICLLCFQNALVNVRDRLFHALFYRTAVTYAHAVPK